MGNVLLSLQNNTLSRANLSDESGIAKNVHYGDVLIKFGEVLDVRKEKLPMITDENVLSKYKASFLQNGDVIVADTAEDSTVGKCSEIAGLNDEVVLSGLHTIPYRPIEKFASGYLGYYLNSGAYHNQLIPLMQGIKVTSISKSAMQDTDIDYPKSQEEQGKMLEEYGITEEEYEKYVGRYQNVMEEIKLADGEEKGEPPVGPEEIEVDPDYELMAYSNTKIDYEYIIKLIQNIVTPNEDEEEISSEERQKQIEEVKQYIEEMRKDNAKVADIMSNLVYEIELDERKYRGQSILNIVENMKHDCIDKVVSDFCRTWYASKEDVMYAALHYRNGEIPNESVIKSTIDYTMYKEVQEKAVPKFKYYAQCMKELKKVLDEEIKPLIDIA